MSYFLSCQKTGLKLCNKQNVFEALMHKSVCFANENEEGERMVNNR